MKKAKKPKRKCRQCKRVLPVTRYFNCTRCQPSPGDEDYINCYGGVPENTATTNCLIRNLNK